MTKNGSNGGKPDVSVLREDIRQTRAELGETVQALAAKADVKARAKDSVEHTKQRVKAQVVLAGDKARGAALRATDKVRQSELLDKVQQSGVLDKVQQSGALDRIQQAGARARRNPVPLALAAAATIAIILLIGRGRRR